MTVREQVLHYLTDREGEWVSGDALGKELYASRNAVWKAVEALRREGAGITAQPGVGYRFDSPPERMTAARIRRKMKHPEAYRIEVLETVDSTNRELKRRAEAGETEGAAVFAETQTAGRGRLGRSFYSPPAAGVYGSILLRPRIPADQALFLTTAAAVAAARAISDAVGRQVGIKWVNDLFLDGKKVCGILTEADVDLESGMLRYAVCGIGINVSPAETGFPEELKAVAGTLRGACDGDGRAALAAALLDRFSECVTAPKEEILEEYRSRSILIGKQVFSPAGAFPGAARVMGIDDQARLLLRTETGDSLVLSCGEVSVRLVEGENT